jgi:amino-acid N-acetyltransferase
MKQTSFSFASADDLDAVVALLRGCGLPYEDIGEHLSDLIAARQGKTLIGTVALQACDGFGLLRSLAVTESYRRQGLATDLVTRIVTHARSKRIERLFLLTTPAQNFFAKRGFEPLDRSLVPAAISGTEEFRSLCPASAVCMSKEISVNLT